MDHYHSIIVYRNPLEKQLWEGVMGSPNFVLAIMTFAGVMFFSFLAIHWVLEKAMGTNGWRTERSRFNVHIAGLLSFAIGSLAMWYVLLH